MSLINAVRFVNINYNNDNIRITDECLYFDGKSTLISLENGGGKSVMVQMMMAPFVQKSRRDLADRKFSSYFLTPNPSFILVEWKLDDAAENEKVMIGMMVRRNQHTNEIKDNENELEVVNFVSEYNKQCEADIFHLAVTEKQGDHVVLKNFSECLSLFTKLKNNRSFKFSFYNMNVPYQSTNYFNKIKEFGINYKEWHEIIREVNKEEGGLSKIFSECKDERRLIEKWIFPKIEAKLNKEKNIIENLQENVEKFILHRYQSDESIIKQEAILKFKADAEEILNNATVLFQAQSDELNNTLLIKSSVYKLKQEILPAVNQDIEKTTNQITEIDNTIKHLQYEEYSLDYYQKLDELDKLNVVIGKTKEAIDTTNNSINTYQRTRNIYACILLQKEFDDVDYRYNKAKAEQEVAQNKLKDSNAEIERLGSYLKSFYAEQLKEQETALAETNQEIASLEKETRANNKERQNIQKNLQSLHEKTGQLKNVFADYEQSEDKYLTKYQVKFASDFADQKYQFPLSVFEQHEADLATAQTNLQKTIDKLRIDATALSRSLQELQKKNGDTHTLLSDTEVKKTIQQAEVDKFDTELDERRVILKYLDLPEKKLFDTTLIMDRLQIKIASLETVLNKNAAKDREIRATLAQYEHGFLGLTPTLTKFFQDLDIPITYGLEWLKRHKASFVEKQKLVERHKLLPYALIIEENDWQKISEASQKVPTETPIPLILRQSLAKDRARLPEEGLHFYAHFDQAILDAETLAKRIQSLNDQLAKIASEQEARNRELDGYRERLTQIKRQAVTENGYKQSKQAVQDLLKKIDQLKNELLSQKDQDKKIKANQQSIQKQIEDTLLAKQESLVQKEDFRLVHEKYKKYLKAKEDFKKCQESMESLDEQRRNLETISADLATKVQFARDKKSELTQNIRTLRSGKYQTYQDYPDPGEMCAKEDIPGIESRYDTIVASLQGTLTVNLKRIEDDLQSYHKKLKDYQKKLESSATSFKLTPEDWKTSSITEVDDLAAEDMLKNLHVRLRSKTDQYTDLSRQLGAAQSKVDTALANLKQRLGLPNPLPREELVPKNFKHEIHQKVTDKNSLQTELATLSRTKEHLATTAEVYVEYFEPKLSPTEIVLPDYFDLETLNTKQIADFLKKSVEDLTNARYKIGDLKNGLSSIIGQIYNNSAYDPIRRILPNLQPIATDAAKILRDLPVKIKIFDDMLQKMAKDLSKLAEEKSINSDLLFDYVEKVHSQLNLIDKNSAITIRDKSRKPLKIDTLDWQANTSITQTKINDFLDSLITEGLKLLKASQEIHDTIALNLTTRDLYDRIVGIGTIKIHLIKVEAQREIMIPWHSVTTNSGGEGFLSAFIVLSSLLSYMRYTDASQFTRETKKEGKILLMDNPFGKTNATHLLKPLMEIAQRNNLQLICLTGLGGDSIYDRFDNIYVLNLIPASDTGTSYVKSTLEKGNAPAVISLARVYVYDEETLSKELSKTEEED